MQHIYWPDWVEYVKQGILQPLASDCAVWIGLNQPVFTRVPLYPEVGL